MPNDNAQKEKDKELIEIAAEQFARLFWKQWHLGQGSRRPKFKSREDFRNPFNNRKVMR